MAKGRLSKQEKYVIEGMLKDNYSVSDIAKELGRTEKTIRAHAGTTQTTIKKKKRVKKQEPPKPAKAKDLMVNTTAVKKSKGAKRLYGKRGIGGGKHVLPGLETGRNPTGMSLITQRYTL